MKINFQKDLTNLSLSFLKVNKYKRYMYRKPKIDFKFETCNSNLEQTPHFFFQNRKLILPDPSCFFVFPGNETCGFQGTSNQIPCDILDIHENKAVFSLVESVFP